MNIEIAERIAKATNILCQCKSNKIEIPKDKMKIYKTMIRPLVKYSSDTWTLTAEDEKNLRIFERHILRKIFGTVKIYNI
jgi:hypothetical protein